MIWIVNQLLPKFKKNDAVCLLGNWEQWQHQTPLLQHNVYNVYNRGLGFLEFP